MLDFVFFDPRTRRQFVDFIQDHGLLAQQSEDDETYAVAVTEDLDDALLEVIEARYDELIALDQSLFEADAAAAGEHTAGVVVNLASGTKVYAQVDPLLLGRIMEVLTPQEFGQVVDAIVDAVERPDPRPLCERSA
jgi:uncharacterized protein YicC (UPF0701 family)